MKTVIKIIAIILAVVIFGSIVLTLVGGIDLRAINPWLDEEKASDINKMEIFNYNYGVAPNSQVKCLYTTDKEIISNALDHYGDARISPVWNILDMGLYVGGFSEDIVFTYADGSGDRVSISNGYYIAGLFLLNMNTTSDFSTVGMNSFFRFMANDESYKVYTAGDEKKLVKEVSDGASELGFEIYEGEADKADATHIIETSFGTVYVITDKICYLDIKQDLLGTGDGYFTLYSASFDDIVK